MNARFARHLIEAASDPSSPSPLIILLLAMAGSILKVFLR
jgi:hypothetical protein